MIDDTDFIHITKKATVLSNYGIGAARIEYLISKMEKNLASIANK